MPPKWFLRCMILILQLHRQAKHPKFKWTAELFIKPFLQIASIWLHFFLLSVVANSQIRHNFPDHVSVLEKKVITTATTIDISGYLGVCVTNTCQNLFQRWAWAHVFSYVCRWVAVQTTGCLGDRYGLMSLLVGTQGDTDKRPYHGNQSFPR